MNCVDWVENISIGQLGDNETAEVVIDISRWLRDYPQLVSFHIEVVSPGGVEYIAGRVARDRGKLIWTITSADTASAGRGSYRIVGLGANGERKASEAGVLKVQDSMPGFSAGEAPEPMRPFVDEVVTAANRAEEAAKHSPIIGENGNWYLWDAEAGQHVDSGKPSAGDGSGWVQTVNGMRPDGSGNVQVEIPEIPARLPNPEAVTFVEPETGRVIADYDGGKAVRVEAADGAYVENKINRLVPPMVTWEAIPDKPFGEDADGTVRKMDSRYIPGAGVENAGKILYVAPDGTVRPLTLGEGLKIVDGVLTITGAVVPPVEPEEIVFTVDDAGDMYIEGFAASVDDDGDMTIMGLTAEIDEAGNMIFVRE